MNSTSIFTIGHGRQPIESFIELLVANKIEALADVRAIPRSRWPQFNQKALIQHLGKAKIRYIHFKELGGKIEASQEEFDQGIEELSKLIEGERVCMMCAESLPEKCHRTLKLQQPLLDRGITVVHIYPNGELKSIKAG
jgi:uncharacterized protein (DUF488 family)